MRRRTLQDCAVSSACRKAILNADSSDGVDGAQPDDATAMRTSMAQIRHDYNAAPLTHPHERILFSMVRGSNKLPRISSEFQSRSARIRSPMAWSNGRRAGGWCESRPCGVLFDCERRDDRSRGK